jgi:hypothetical protein
VKEVLARRAELGDAGAIGTMGDAWSVIAPDVEFDLTPIVGGSANVYNGHSGFLDYWEEWLGLWDEYVYSAAGYQAVGDWIVADVSVRAHGRHGVPLDLRVGQAFLVRDGQIARIVGFPSPADARARLGRDGFRGAIDRIRNRA